MLSRDWLEEVLSAQFWNTPRSGNSIPIEKVPALDALWQLHLARVGVSPVA